MGRIRGDLLDRSFRLAAAVVDVAEELPPHHKTGVVGRQLLRSGTSVGANLWEANKAVSRADFAYRCGVARKEASETQYWLGLCQHTGILKRERIRSLFLESEELISILTTIMRTTRKLSKSA